MKSYDFALYFEKAESLYKKEIEREVDKILNKFHMELGEISWGTVTESGRNYDCITFQVNTSDDMKVRVSLLTADLATITSGIENVVIYC